MIRIRKLISQNIGYYSHSVLVYIPSICIYIYRRPNSLRDILVHAKLNPDPSDDGPTGESKPCGNKRCFTCRLMTPTQIAKSSSGASVKLKSRKENPQKLTQLSSRSHPRHLVEKRTAQKDINIDTTSDSQVNSNFPNKWSPASLTFNNYFYLFLYLYIT